MISRTSSAVGSEPLLADVILQRATEAASEARAGANK